ncbi:hypothetical protein OQH60_01845 [Campylobacter sp. MIT 21-1685]|uniref:hypothetical protein n=1 Tax=unclassified Campylobacter TaxID=2593542 RepID=UPI00224AABAC|nr:MULTISPECIES: hypothetical protein [unclassified Campylobacter]MCX2682687.1 hypothetical protein [Campylobacter sp. MIT 21-1684]MCX2750967.1 hypothetical protein [Campylobacter sp. MIT 21-1682]MCX2807100.1 hypothetical protein [Campylobacter sp. MIT 21-1685]
MKTKNCFVSLCIGTALFNTTANAQDDYALDKVVITANGFEQNVDSRLRNVMVIQGKELEKYSFSSLE